VLRNASVSLVIALLVGGGTAGSAERLQQRHGEPAAASSSSGDVLVVAIEGNPDSPFAFEPAELTVEAGTTVRWRNTTDQVFHTVTFSDSLDQRIANGVFDHSLLAADDVAEYTFDEPGTYSYFCQPHSSFMAGTIIVTEPQDESAWRRWAIWVGGAVVVAAAVGAAVTYRRRR